MPVPSRHSLEATTTEWESRGLRHLSTLDPRKVKDALEGMRIGDCLVVNAHVVVRKRTRVGLVGRDEWDVDGARLIFRASWEGLIPEEKLEAWKFLDHRH